MPSRTLSPTSACASPNNTSRRPGSSNWRESSSQRQDELRQVLHLLLGEAEAEPEEVVEGNHGVEQRPPGRGRTGRPEVAFHHALDATAQQVPGPRGVPGEPVVEVRIVEPGAEQRRSVEALDVAVGADPAGVEEGIADEQEVDDGAVRLAVGEGRARVAGGTADLRAGGELSAQVSDLARGAEQDLAPFRPLRVEVDAGNGRRHDERLLELGQGVELPLRGLA